MPQGSSFRYDYSRIEQRNDTAADVDWAHLAEPYPHVGVTAGRRRPLVWLARAIVLGAAAIGIYFGIAWIGSDVPKSTISTGPAADDKGIVQARKEPAVRHKGRVPENSIVPLTSPASDIVIVTADSPEASLPFTIDVLTSSGRVRLWLHNGGYYVDASGRIWVVRSSHGSTVIHPEIVSNPAAQSR